MPRTPSLLLSALAPLLALAQTRTDTVAMGGLRAFETRMLAQPVRPQPAAPLNKYKLVWTEHNNGYFIRITPGDTTTLSYLLAPAQGLALGFMEGVTYYGEHYAMLVRDRPVSMLDITRWFFERRPGNALSDLATPMTGIPSIDLFIDHPPDSLVDFREAMPRDSLMGSAPAPPKDYALVWKEERLLQNYSVTRGDGSTMQDLLGTDGRLRPEVQNPSHPGGVEYHGQRYAKVWVRSDKGLMIYTTWYFERRLR